MMKTIFQACVVCAVLLTVACKSSSTKEANTLFKKMDADSTGIHFTNTITDNEEFNIFSYRNFYNGGGVAIGDINNDSPMYSLLPTWGPINCTSTKAICTLKTSVKRLA